MPVITLSEPFTHATLPGVRIFSLSGSLSKGHEQEILVCAEPNTEIELHTHSVDAHMIITGGAAVVLSGDPETHGAHVTPGSCVFFEKHVPHGFKVSDQGLTFISKNGGIVGNNGKWDIDYQ